MPKLITTRTRTADLGKPGIISISEDDSEQGAMKGRQVNVDFSGTLSHSLLRTLSYFVPVNGLKTTAVKTAVPETHAPTSKNSTYHYAYAYLQNSSFFLSTGVHY